MADISYHEKMAKDAATRAKIIFQGRPDAAGQPKVIVEPARRRDVESFANRLRGYEPPMQPERQDYARMDASAILINFSMGNDQVLAQLQNCVLNQDMGAFVDVMDKHRIGVAADRANLRNFVHKQDRPAIAAVLRMISRDIVAGKREPTEEMGVGGQVDVGVECANRTRGLMGLRRSIDTTFLKGKNVHYTAPFRKTAEQLANATPVMMSAIEFGEACDEWEKCAEFQPMILDACNAASDMMSEAAGYGKFDGRMDGKGNPWANQTDPSLAQTPDFA